MINDWPCLLGAAVWDYNNKNIEKKMLEKHEWQNLTKVTWRMKFMVVNSKIIFWQEIKVPIFVFWGYFTAVLKEVAWQCNYKGYMSDCVRERKKIKRACQTESSELSSETVSGVMWDKREAERGWSGCTCSWRRLLRRTSRKAQACKKNNARAGGEKWWRLKNEGERKEINENGLSMNLR